MFARWLVHVGAAPAPPPGHTEQQAAHLCAWECERSLSLLLQVYEHIHMTPDFSIQLDWQERMVCAFAEKQFPISQFQLQLARGKWPCKYSASL